MANNVSLSYPSSFYHQFFDRNGKPLTSGKLYTYIAGSTTPVVTYKTISGGTESANRNTNPIILDMAGMAELVISNDTAYKFVLFDKNNVKIDEWDNVTAGGSEGGGSSNVYVEGTSGEIDVEEESAGLTRRFIVSLSDTIKNAISNLSYSVNDIINALYNKKDKQQPVTKLGSATKVPVSIQQNNNGVLDVVFDEIAFPDWTTAINNAVSNCENLSNKKNSVTGYESSTTAYPSIKAVVDFVEAMMQNIGGKLITDGGDAFTDVTDLPDTTPFDDINIQDNDYAYVQGTGFASRYSATIDGSSVTWTKEYEINIPVFTPSQQASIDSGVTAEMLGTFLTKTGDGKDVTVTYTPQSSGNPANISSGSKLSDIFSKIQYWFTKFGSLAWKNTITNSDISGTISDSHIDSANAWNNALGKDVSYNTTKSWLKIGTIASQLANVMYRGVTLSVEYRANDGNTQSGLLWISAGEYKASGDYGNDDIVAEYSTIGRRTNTLTEDVKFYVKSLGTSSTSGVEIYAYLYNYSELSITPLNVPEGSYTPEMTYINNEPSGKKEVTYNMLLRIPYGTSKGSSLLPVYVDSYGNIHECLPPSVWSVGSAQAANHSTKLYSTSYGGSNVPFCLKADGSGFGNASPSFKIPHTAAIWHQEINNGTITGIGVTHYTSKFVNGPSSDLVLGLETPSTNILQLTLDARTGSSWKGGQVWGTIKWDSQTGSNLTSFVERIGNPNMSGDVVLTSRNLSVSNVQDIQGHAIFAVCTGNNLNRYVIDMEISVIKPQANSTLCYLTIMSKCFEDEWFE